MIDTDQIIQRHETIKISGRNVDHNSDITGKNLIFLISQPRAGSTMLQKVLGGHSKIDTASEPWIMLHPIFALKQQQLDAPFEPHLAEMALEDFVKNFPERMELFFEAVRRYAQTFYRRSLEKSQKPLFLDKTPRYYMIMPELARCFPKAKFIVLMRNPMAVLSSMLITWFKNNPHALINSRSYNDLIDAPKMLLDGLKLIGKNGYVVHYENVVQETEKEIKQLCRWLNIDFEPNMVHYGRKNIANGRLGDQIGVATHNHPVTNSIDKWTLNLRTRNLKRFASKVLQSIGHETIANLGYNVSEILNILNADHPISGSHQNKSSYTGSERSSAWGRKTRLSAQTQTKNESNDRRETNQLVRFGRQNIKHSLKCRTNPVKKHSDCWVTLILPTKNRNDGLKETLESIPEAMQDISYEILLYADKEREEFKDYINKYPIKKVFYDRDVFDKDEQFSWSKLMNHGFAQAAGEWIMYGSDDIVFYPGCFKMACEALHGLNDGSIGGVTFFHRNTAETYDGFFQDYGYDTLNGDKPFINFGLIKADAYRKTNGFDEKLMFFWADVDICVQTLRCGYKIIPSPGSLVDHNNILEKKQKGQRIALFEKDTAYFYSKWRDDEIFRRSNPLDKVRYFLSKKDNRNIIEFLKEKFTGQREQSKVKKLNIVIDGVIFQLQAGKAQGISRVWRNLIPALIRQMPNFHVIILQRGGYPIPIDGVNIHNIPAFRLEGDNKLDEDDEMLRQTCRDLKADLFLSTYFTRAPGVKNVVMAHDLIPEKLQLDLSQSEWRSKQRAIETADAFICVSHTTQNDLVAVYPQIANRPIIVAHNGLDACFNEPTEDEVSRIRRKFNLARPYVMLVGNRRGYKNGRKMLAALSEIQDQEKPTVLCVGGEHPPSKGEIRLKEKLDIRFAGQLNDQDLVAAYGGALALMVPSQYEGFGLPVIEAMACGCPVIANRSQAVSEVGGNAVCYVDLCSRTEISEALKTIKRNSPREDLKKKGRDQVKRFNWSATSRNIGDFINALINKSSILLTAVVSTYNAEAFMGGCLEDLEKQTIAGRLEIIVVDSASEQDEAAIVRDFQRRYANIKYIRTPQRESVYQSWNRGIKFASGKYITNANTDDRHRQDAFELMTDVLDNDESVALVYADVIKTRTANETFRHCTPTGMLRWYDWNRRTLLEKGCFIGPQPVWRKRVHAVYGYFDERYAISSDFEFWLRISQTNDFYHLSKPLGLYLERADSIEHANDKQKAREDSEIIQLYRQAAGANELIGIASETKEPSDASASQEEMNIATDDEKPYRKHQLAANESMQGGHLMNSPETIFKAIEHLVDGGHNESACWVMDKLLQDYPDDARIHNAMAAMAYAQGDTQNALVHYQRAAGLSPQNPAFLKDLGDFYYVVHQDAENAMAQYQKVLQVDPDCVDALTMAGHVSISLHRYSDAQQYYERVLCLDPNNGEVCQYLEKMKTPSGESASEATNSVEDSYAAAQTKVQSGDREAAIALLEQLLEQENTHALSHNDLGVLYYENGNMEAALLHYKQAAALMPEQAVFQKNLADFYWAELGDHQRALKTYLEVLKLDPRDVDAMLGCGQICLSLGKESDARDFMDTVLQIEPWNENAQQLLGRIETSAGEATFPDQPGDLYEQAQVKSAAGDLDGAITDLEQLINSSPNNAAAYNDLGVLYYEAGNKDGALAAYEQAVEHDPNAVNYLKNLADFYLVELGRGEDAMKLYLQVMEENPEDIECLTAAGMICSALGNVGDASFFYHRVLDLEPWNETAQQALNNLKSGKNEAEMAGTNTAVAG